MEAMAQPILYFANDRDAYALSTRAGPYPGSILRMITSFIIRET